MANIIEGSQSLYVQTTNATPTNIADVQLPANSSAHITLRGVARRASNDNTKTWLILVAIKRVGDDVSILGTPTNLLTPIGDLGAITWDFDFDTVGDTLKVQCKGQSSATIDWFVRYESLTIQE